MSDDEWAFVAPYLTRWAKRPPSGSVPCAKRPTACAGLCEPVPLGGCCPTIWGPGDAPALAALLDRRQTPVLIWDGENIWLLRDCATTSTGQIVLFGRMERLAGKITHTRQGERVVAWQTRPYQNGSPADDLAWYGVSYGIEAGPTRLETMRRLVLHLAVEAPLILEQPEQTTICPIV